MTNPFGVHPTRLDLAAIARWNHAQRRSRAAYHADMATEAGACAIPRCPRKRERNKRRCWTHRDTKEPR